MVLGFEMHAKSSQIPLDTIIFYELRKYGDICPAFHDNRWNMPKRSQVATKMWHQPLLIHANSPLPFHVEGYVSLAELPVQEHLDAIDHISELYVIAEYWMMLA